MSEFSKAQSNVIGNSHYQVTRRYIPLFTWSCAFRVTGSNQCREQSLMIVQLMRSKGEQTEVKA